MSPIERSAGGGGASAGGLIVIYDSGQISPARASIDTGAGTIGATHGDLRVLLYLRSTQAVTNDQLRINFNGDNGTNYICGGVFGATGSGSWVNQGTAGMLDPGMLDAASRPANFFSEYDLTVTNYAGSNFKVMAGNLIRPESTTTMTTSTFSGQWFSTVAISRIAISPVNGPNFLAGSRMVVYGLQ